VFTRALHWSISWARSVQSTPPHRTSLISILILSTHRYLGLPTGLFWLAHRYLNCMLRNIVYRHRDLVVPIPFGMYSVLYLSYQLEVLRCRANHISSQSRWRSRNLKHLPCIRVIPAQYSDFIQFRPTAVRWRYRPFLSMTAFCDIAPAAVVIIYCQCKRTQIMGIQVESTVNW
jgi:hypothetical protein